MGDLWLFLACLLAALLTSAQVSPVLCFSTFDSIPVTRQEVSLVDRAGQAELGAESDCWGQVLQKRGQGESLQGIHLLLFSVTLLTNAFWSG